MDVLMPQLGETVAEGKIIQWFKSVGDTVRPGENLCEVETDKVTVEVPSIGGGVLQAINVAAGEVAPVGAVIAVVGDGAVQSAPAARPVAPAAQPAAPIAAAPPPKPAAAPPAAIAAAPAPVRGAMDPYHEVRTPTRNFGPATLAGGVVVSPLARRLAAGAGIDLATVAGSGARGRITGVDVERAIASRSAAAPASVAPAEEPIGEAWRGRPHKVVPLDGMRRTIARRLTLSKTTVPHFYVVTDVEVDRLARVREEVNAGAPKDGDGMPTYRLSINDFLIKALALALQRVPTANAVWSADGILQFEHSDVGVAVAIPGGLLTPVVTAAESKSLSTISREMKDLAKRARNRALQPHEYQGGTTSISNLGMYGVREFSAIINPPQATILAVGATQRHAVETKDGGVAFVGRIAATLSCDHRVVDGVLGAELLTAFKSLVENPLRMIV